MGWYAPPIGASHPSHPSRQDTHPGPGIPSWEHDQEAFDFEERAAIREYDGGLPRAAAERLASMDLINHRRRAA